MKTSVDGDMGCVAGCWTLQPNDLEATGSLNWAIPASWHEFRYIDCIMTSSLGCLPYTMTSSFEPVCEYIVLFIVTGLVKMELWHGQQCFVCSATIYLQVCKPCAAGSAQPSGAALECEPCQSLAGARVVTCKPPWRSVKTIFNGLGNSKKKLVCDNSMKWN